MRRVLAAAVVTVMLGTACGGGSEIPADMQVKLQTQLDRVRTATDAGDIEGAEDALRNLRRSVKLGAASGDIPEAEAVAILAGADKIAAELKTLAGGEIDRTEEPEGEEPEEAEEPEEVEDEDEAEEDHEDEERDEDKDDSDEDHGKSEERGRGHGD
jgi:hypothetical protein